jgi:MoxR-like ATPase
MDAAMIARVMSAIPERAAWAHTGTAFEPHDAQGAQVKYLAQFLQWLSPLTQLTKDDQRALGLLATHHRPIAEEEAELEEDADVAIEGELEDDATEFDPEATFPPSPREEEKAEVLATTTQ